jgi:energy-converting hydrogenase Eha subunit F
MKISTGTIIRILIRPVIVLAVQVVLLKTVALVGHSVIGSSNRHSLKKKGVSKSRDC